MFATLSRSRLWHYTKGLALAGALAAFGTASGTASANETVKVRLDYLPYGMHAPFYLAQEKGWFAEKGLRVEIDDGNGTGPAVALLASNKIDVAYANLSAVSIARDKGAPVKAIAGIVRKGDYGLIVDANGPIKSPSDLEGKTIIYSPSSSETPFIDTYLKRAGVDKRKVNLMSVDLAAKVSSYMSGKADGMLTLVPLYTLKDFTPRPSRGLLYADVGINILSMGLISNEKTIAERPQVLAGFVATMQRSWEAIYRGGAVEEAVAALIKHRPNAKLDPKLMKAQIESLYPFLNTEASKDKPLLWMPPSDWEATISVLEEIDLIKKGTKPETHYTNQFVPMTK